MSEGGKWTGWLRRSVHSPWEKVCSADDLRTCHVALLRLAAERGVPCIHTFMTASGRRPPEATEAKQT